MKVGDKVVFYRVGKVVAIHESEPYPLEVEFENGSGIPAFDVSGFTADGKTFEGDAAPSLFLESEFNKQKTMTDKKITDWQNSIMRKMANPERGRTLSWVVFVYFHPPFGCFMYDDAPIPHWVIYPLIESELLVYAGQKKHQGDYYSAYQLSESTRIALHNSK